MKITISLVVLLGLQLGAGALTPAESELKQILGAGTPDPIPLWPDKPPCFAENAPAETVSSKASLKLVSVPTITVYLPPKEKNTGRALLVCAGGGYGGLDWRTHVVYAARVFNPLGVAVIGLKYRTRPPNGTANEDIQAIALLDAKRAMRTLRHRAAEWRLDPRQIGVAGYSAGGNLAMNLAADNDAGDLKAKDEIERQSSRPDFAVGLATWHWRQKTSPFKFTKDAPPVFLVHATNDGITGGAPIELPRAIKSDLEKLGVPVRMEVFDEGGHGVGNLIPQRVEHGFPPAKWPQLLLQWLDTLPRAAARP
jgi:acetyl esterase/lipase